MSESIEKTIDIDKILKSKMGSKVKFVPRFLVSWCKSNSTFSNTCHFFQKNSKKAKIY